METSSYRVPRAVLAESDDAELAWRVVEPLWTAINLDADAHELHRQLAALSAGQRALLAIDWCVKEVLNGGFDQYFANSAGNLADDALTGFRLIGATAYSEALGRAMNIFADGAPSPIRAARTEQLRGLTPVGEQRVREFEDIDSAFWRLMESDDIEPYRARYVREHPEDFVLD